MPLSINIYQLTNTHRVAKVYEDGIDDRPV